MAQNTYNRISKNINPLKKWWIEKTVDKNNKIVSTGSFNTDLYERFKNAVSVPLCSQIQKQA
jgi:hypothetical protein